MGEFAKSFIMMFCFYYCHEAIANASSVSKTTDPIQHVPEDVLGKGEVCQSQLLL
jgi:hypothetical protein